MPIQTNRLYHWSAGLWEERYVTQTGEPCQQCGDKIIGRASRLKEEDGRIIRGYRRVCYQCASEYCNTRMRQRVADQAQQQMTAEESAADSAWEKGRR